MDFKVERLDHLGIVSGIIKDLNIVETVNARLRNDARAEISDGEAVAGMILNGLGFTSKPLCLTPEFFNGKPLELLFKEGIKAEYFNRSKLGRVLDNIFNYGCSNLFFEIASAVCIQEKVSLTFNSLDTTSISVDGEYAHEDERAVHITHGYSKDHRKDLKQVVQELLVSQDGGIPLAMSAYDGNASDNEIFKHRSKELLAQFKDLEVPRYLIADSKLYTKENSSNLKNLSFITRIPRSNKEENIIVQTSFSKECNWVKLSNGDFYQEHFIEHNGISQRWLVIKSEAAKKRAIKQINRKVLQELNKAKQFNKNNIFYCQSDATKALEKLKKILNVHKVIAKIEPLKKEIEKEEREIFKVLLELEELPAKIQSEIEEKACYTLGTNINQEELGAEEVIAAYKRQNSSIENMGFRFLKDPMFFTSSFFLKKNSRIEALLCIMTLSLLVYSIAQRRARAELGKKEEVVPNQIKKPIKNPTARWLFQLMNSINVVHVTIGGAVQTVIEGITELQRRISSLFGETVHQIYNKFATKFVLAT